MTKGAPPPYSLSPFDIARTALLCLWIFLNCALTLWLVSAVSLALAASVPALACVFLFQWSTRGRIILLEVEGSLDLRSQFLIFLFCAIFALVLPKLIDRSADWLLCLAALNAPMLAIACRPRHFRRLYFLNLLLIALLVRRVPGFPVWLLAVEALLICGCFAADYLAEKTETLPITGRLDGELLVRSAMVYVIAALGALAICWILAPWESNWTVVDAPTYFDGDARGPGRQASAPRPMKELLPQLATRMAIAIVLMIVLVLLLNWAQKFLARRKGKGELTAGEGRMTILDRRSRQGRGRKQWFDLGSPRGKIVYAYNLLLKRLAEKGLAKTPGSTPSEFAEELEDISSAPPKSAQDAADTFEEAHYGQREFSEAEAAKYRERIERLSKETGRLSAEEDVGTGV